MTIVEYVPSEPLCSTSQLSSSDPSVQSGSPSQRQCFVTHNPSSQVNHSSGLQSGWNPRAAPITKINMTKQHRRRSRPKPRRAECVISKACLRNLKNITYSIKIVFLKMAEKKRSYLRRRHLVKDWQ